MYTVELYLRDSHSSNEIVKHEQWHFRNKKNAKKLHRALNKYYDNLGSDKPFYVESNYRLNAIRNIDYSVYLFEVHCKDDQIEELVLSALENGTEYDPIHGY
jgi:hypothetical protein